jgi:hypothetical protein
VHEYYVRGELVRRESDRNFDDRIDLVEDFDATSHGRVRAVIDSDFDGTADLLVLFQAGRPIFSKWAPSSVRDDAPGAPATDPLFARRGNAPLSQLTDPFLGDLALRSTLNIPESDASVWTAAGLAWSPTATAREFRPPTALSARHPRPLSQRQARRAVPRGPPLV